MCYYVSGSVLFLSIGIGYCSLCQILWYNWFSFAGMARTNGFQPFLWFFIHFICFRSFSVLDCFYLSVYVGIMILCFLDLLVAITLLFVLLIQWPLWWIYFWMKYPCLQRFLCADGDVCLLHRIKWLGVWPKVLTTLWLYQLLMSHEDISMGKLVYFSLKTSVWWDILWQPMVNQSLCVLGVFASRKEGCSVHNMIDFRAIIWFWCEHW